MSMTVCDEPTTRRLLSTENLLERWGCGRSTFFDAKRKDWRFPKPVVIGQRCTRYRLEDVERYERACQEPVGAIE